MATPGVIGSFSYAIPLLSTLILVITGTGKLTAASQVGMFLIVAGILIGSGVFFRRESGSPNPLNSGLTALP